MGLLDKIFANRGSTSAPPAAAPAAEFKESDVNSDGGDTKESHRREMVQVVLRETMGQHGIPSDWIELRLLAGTQPNRNPGLHATFIVRDGQDRLLTYVFAFQESFRIELARLDPRCADWLMSLAWEFAEDGLGHRKQEVPRPSSRGAAAEAAYARGSNEVVFSPDPESEAAEAAAAAVQAPESSDLTMRAPPPDSAREQARDQARDQAREEVEDDLVALYAALKQASVASASAALESDKQPDFEPTRPGEH